jgi:cytoskeletal protein CcmA (bactofilin family)
MPLVAASKLKTIAVTCPSCGNIQPEPRSAYSSVCKKCRKHFRLQEALHPAAIPAKPAIESRRIRCFQCDTELDVPLSAESTMCKRCSSHVDLTDYHITQTVSRNFRTHGRLVIEEKGYVLNTEALVQEAVVKGRLIGKLVARGTLEIHTSANIRGQFGAGCLVIPQGHCFRWPEPLRVGGAEIGGELVAQVRASGTVKLKSTARFFGEVEAGNLVVEAGAVFVGSARVGRAG